MKSPLSERLRYRPVEPADLDAFHRLVQDEHVRLATEMGRASIVQAGTQLGFAEIEADVDEVNAASVRVLEKLGFERLAARC